ncbi:hypothetical protein FNH13_17710 [Ornithinimicrobium ciconiae]|uniref:Immunity protein 63 domain-containing protein n=1 Tax=Ornithinimicrobium ciconiae TaxID=2594265 RepID=A0A516GEH4_9MICO|nr:hypothetical protein [Ornithinimicrobium ciconiae]QDO89937.1 hypothetical protein FNH13_17710 [Ornithinimicrobium ciconiae]
MFGSSERQLKRLVEKLGPLCSFWDVGLVDMQRDRAVVVHTYPGITETLYMVIDGFWYAWSFLLDSNGNPIPGGPPPAPLHVVGRDIDEAVSRIVLVHVHTYRQALAARPDAEHRAVFGAEHYTAMQGMAQSGLHQLTRGGR